MKAGDPASSAANRRLHTSGNCSASSSLQVTAARRSMVRHCWQAGMAVAVWTVLLVCAGLPQIPRRPLVGRPGPRRPGRNSLALALDLTRCYLSRCGDASGSSVEIKKGGSHGPTHSCHHRLSARCTLWRIWFFTSRPLRKRCTTRGLAAQNRKGKDTKGNSGPTWRILPS
jgi:hypothetical protein